VRVEILYSNDCPGWPQRAVVANRLGDGAAKAVDAHLTRQHSIHPADCGPTVAAASPVSDSLGAAGHQARGTGARSGSAAISYRPNLPS